MIGKRCAHCDQPVPEYGGIVADDERGEIRFNKKVIYLPSHEFALFRALLDAHGRTLTKEQLLNATKTYLVEDDMREIKIVDVFVCKIRKKVNSIGLRIETVWARGYYLKEPTT